MYDMVPDRAALAAYTIHFAFDSAVIRDSEQANLQSVASALTADPNTKLLIEGNCDERGTEEYNRALGERRALAAREALAKLGVDPMRIFTRSATARTSRLTPAMTKPRGRRTAATISCCSTRNRVPKRRGQWAAWAAWAARNFVPPGIAKAAPIAAFAFLGLYYFPERA